MQKVIVLTGAGISAESGISTFRGSNGLWEGYDIRDVATPEAWHRNRALVLKFYNERRKKLRLVEPNSAHFLLAELERDFKVVIITQNVDDLHERAGSSRVIHLHGELRKAQSTKDPQLVYDLGDRDIYEGDHCEKGAQLRPYIVWFGEAVPMFEKAARLCEDAEFFVIIGTSMQVYPAASLIHYTPKGIPTYFIDPDIPAEVGDAGIICINEKATTGMALLMEMLLKEKVS